MDPLDVGTETSEFRQLRRRLLIAAAAFVAVLGVGVAGYRVLQPETSWLDALYMAVITLTTVGYGEIVDPTAAVRIFTIVLLVAGLGVAAVFASTAAGLLIEGYVAHVFWKRRMQRQAGKLSEHYIVCGGGEAALHAVAELTAVRLPVVVVAEPEGQEELAELRDRVGDVPFIVGDPSDDRLLEAANVDRAVGVLACTDSDKDNLVITLTARQTNPKLRIIAQVSRAEMEEKLLRAGADGVVSPNLIGGLRMASVLIRPNVVTFLDQMLRDREMNLRVGEVTVPQESPLVGTSLGEAEVTKGTRALLLAVRDVTGDWAYNPPPETAIDERATLVLMGTPEELERIGNTVRPGALSSTTEEAT